MTARIIDGKALAARAFEQLRGELDELSGRGRAPHLVPILVGDNPAGRAYLRMQQHAAKQIGIDCTPVHLEGTITQEDLEAEIAKISADPSVTGIIVQLPLPGGLDARRAQRLVAPEKDVEGITPASLGGVVLADESMAPTTARAAFELAKSTGVKIEGAEVVIVGHSEIVGKPLSLLFLEALGTTTVCHIATRDLASHTRRADILCVAAGKPSLIGGDMIKPGAVVIDIGINRVAKFGPDGRQTVDEKGKPEMITVGDVDFEAAVKVAGWIAPAPGGVGQMTVAMLMANTVRSARRQFGL